MIQLMQEQQVEMDELEGVETSSEGFDTPIGENITDVVPLLFQSGYLSIKDYDPEEKVYTLGFPNKEVRTGFARTLYKYLSNDYAMGRDKLRMAFIAFRRSDDIEPFLQSLRTFFAGYPYSLNNNNERHYQAVLYTLLVAYGADVQAERQTANGRMDIVLRLPKTIYVIELKYGHSAETALEQVQCKDYAAAFRNDGRRVTTVGISFSRDERTVTEWQVSRE
jgi:thioester reductase-like protein